MIPIEFFQACATIIPTLLVALLIGAKHGTLLAEAARKNQTTLILLTGAGVGGAILISVGELAALMGIMNHGGSKPQAAIFFIIYMLMFEIAGPLSRNMPNNLLSYAVSAVFFLAVLGCLSFALFFIFEYRAPV
ncbi:hypothetical protein [Arthrobacter pascens]|uniref:hypothetical protein n=1 Tax=Arthrobacter pascens TaxID=1677 RepID=UPI0027D7FD64|nr:hypothetical protein [Arthrobacter pascens]